MDGEQAEKKEVRRPMNAFLIFCKKNRGYIRQKHPDMDNREVTRFLGDLWANLGDDKEIYTNQAKLHKETFMKANPGYKWQNTEKSPSSNKVENKRANSRLIKRLAGATTDGNIIPAKLADLKVVDGLNLLLMAGKETNDVHSSTIPKTSCVPLSQTTSKTTSFTTTSTKADLTNQPVWTNSALLQLAEMCSSELKGSTRASHPCLSSHLSLVDNHSTQDINSSTFNCHQPVTKRKKLETLTVSEMSPSKRDLSVISQGINHKDTHTNRGTNLSSWSMEPNLVSASNFFSVEKFKTSSFGRRLSSSETDSVPSPSTPFADEVEDSADSPIISRDGYDPVNHTFPAQGSHLENNKKSPTTSSVSFDGRSTIASDVTSPKIPLSIYQRSCERQSSTSIFDQPNSSPEKRPHLQKSNPGLLRPLLFPESQLFSSNQQSSEYHQNLPVSLFNKQEPEINSSHRSNTKLDKNGYSCFQNWREPGKYKETLDNKFCKSSHSATSSSVVTECSSPLLRLNLSGGKFDSSSCLTRPGGKVDSASPLTKPETDKEKNLGIIPCSGSASIARPLSYGKVTFASLLSEERIASLLSETDTPIQTFPVGVSCNKQERSFLTSGNLFQDLNHSGVENKQAGFGRSREQNCPALKLSLLDRNNSDIVHQPQTSLQTDYLSSVSSIPPTSQSLTFSKGKLKKKWTERMLEEESKVQNQTEMEKNFQNADVKIASSIDHKSCFEGRSICLSEPNHRVEMSTLRNLINSTNLSAGYCSKLEEVKLFGSLDTKDHNRKVITTSSACQSTASLTAPSDPTKCLSSVNSTNHPKLLLQLSHNPQLHKFPNLKFQNSFDTVHVKHEKQEISDWSKPHFNRDPHLAARLKESQAVDCQSPQKKADLGLVAACGQKFMDHVVEKLYRTDFSGDHHLVKAEPAKTSKCVEAFLKDRLKPEREEEFQTVVAGLKEEIHEGFNGGDGLDYSLMAASSLVKKVIRKVYGSPERNREVNPNTTDDHQKLKDTNYGNISFKSSPPWMLENSCINDARQKLVFTSSNVEKTQHQMSPPLMKSQNDMHTTEDTRTEPVRKSRRANRGQKYQELIKEGVIQPSRERLPSKNVGKKGKTFGPQEEPDKKSSFIEREQLFQSPVNSASNTGSLAALSSSEIGDGDPIQDMRPLPVSSFLDHTSKKTAQLFCVEENLSPCHVTSITSSQKSSAHTPGPEHTPQHVPLPKKDKPSEPVVGSRKRKARKHCITRISVLSHSSKDGEGGGKVSSSQVSPVPHKKAHIVSTEGESQDNTLLTNVPDTTEDSKYTSRTSEGVTRLDSSNSQPLVNHVDSCTKYASSKNETSGVSERRDVSEKRLVLCPVTMLY